MIANIDVNWSINYNIIRVLLCVMYMYKKYSSMVFSICENNKINVENLNAILFLYCYWVIEEYKYLDETYNNA